MTKIVIDARNYGSSTGRYVRKLIEYLEKLDANSKRKYQILLTSKDYASYIPKSKNFSKLKVDFKDYSLAEQIGFLRFCRNLQADLIHFSMPQQPIFYKGKTITTVHDLIQLRTFPGNKNKLLYYFKQMVGKYVFKKVGKKSSYVIVNSDYTKNDYLRFSKLNPNKIVTTLLSADKLGAKAQPYTKLSKKRFIMYVGQQSAHKNIKRLIEAHQILLKTQPDLMLVLVGKINESASKNKHFVESRNYKNVLFTGFCKDEQLAWLYQNCQAYVFPSLMEGFGLPGLEAMIYRAPVVSSNATCLPEIYGKAAHYFNPEDVNDIAEKIMQVLNNDKLKKQLVENGRQQLKKYSWEKMANQTLGVYKKTLSE